MSCAASEKILERPACSLDSSELIQSEELSLCKFSSDRVVPIVDLDVLAD